MSSSLKKINVMHTVLSLEVGGLERIVCDTVSGFDKELINVEVCCFDTCGELAEELVGNNINVNLLQRNQNHYDYFFPFRFNKLLREKDIHLLHMHTGTFFLGTQSGVLARTPVMVYTDHGRHLVDPRILLYMDRLCGLFVDKIIAVSKELEDYLVNVVRLPAKKTTYFINGIDTKKYSFRNKSFTLLKEFGIAPNTKVVGTVGRLAEVKDQKSLIEAFAILNYKIPNSVLLLVGDGPMKKKLQQLVNEKELTNKVIFTGNRVDVPDILNLLDVFLLTSLSEGTSVSLLEAMSSGVVPIVTNVGGNPSVVDDGINGLITSIKNVYELSEKIVFLLQHDDIRKEYGENASRKVREKYNLAMMVKYYEKLYLKLLKDKRKVSM